MDKSKTKRVNYLDCAKGIGIILVCLGHAITNTPIAVESNCHILLQFISQFHMPLFFLLSGMVFSDKYVETPFKSSIKKFKAYYIPFVVYNMIFVLLHNVMAKAYIFEEFYDVKTFLKTTIGVLLMKIQGICGAMWFLRALLLIVLLFIWLQYFTKKVLRGKNNEYLVAAIVLFMLILSKTKWCPTFYAMDKVFANISFFYIGYLIKKYNVMEIIKKYWLAIFAAAFIVNLVVALNFNYCLGGGTGVHGFIFVLQFAVQIIGSLMVLALVQAKPVADCKLLITLGRKSLDIMAIHFVCFKLVSLIVILYYGLDMMNMITIPVVYGINFWWSIAYTVVGLAIPTLVRLGYDMIKARIKQRCVRV